MNIGTEIDLGKIREDLDQLQNSPDPIMPKGDLAWKFLARRDIGNDVNAEEVIVELARLARMGTKDQMLDIFDRLRKDKSLPGHFVAACMRSIREELHYYRPHRNFWRRHQMVGGRVRKGTCVDYHAMYQHFNQGFTEDQLAQFDQEFFRFMRKKAGHDSRIQEVVRKHPQILEGPWATQLVSS